MDDGLPPQLDSAVLARDLGNYFLQKVENIRIQLANPPDPPSESSNPSETVAIPASPLSILFVLSEIDVKRLIQNSALKSYLLDPMPSTLVSQCEVLLPILTLIINTSLQSGHFPAHWKEALVFPLLKKDRP